jgi:putative endonuclease
MNYYVYILACKDGTFYTGMSGNLRRRINQHNGLTMFSGARYTKSRRPVFLQHVEKFNQRKEAHKRELEIKEMSHDEKLLLILGTTKEQILSAI